MSDESNADRAARSVELLRVAESRLSRRRQADCGPSETARAAMRYILERDDAGERITPTAIAEHLEVSTASVTGMLTKLRAGGLVHFARNPDDGRSKFVVPVDRNVDMDDIDPLTAHIRRLAERLSDSEATHISEFLDLVRAAVDRECA